MPTKVKFVQYGEQAKVKIVTYGEDMQVTPVDYGEEMKVKSVDYGEDFKVKIVKKDCVITSACIEAKGLPDNCPELNIMRAFRDSYVKSLPKGEEILREYYEVAPQIVSGINRAANPKEIYSNLYEQLLSTIEMIQQGKEDEALKDYLRILNQLKQRYLQ